MYDLDTLDTLRAAADDARAAADAAYRVYRAAAADADAAANTDADAAAAAAYYAYCAAFSVHYRAYVAVRRAARAAR